MRHRSGALPIVVVSLLVAVLVGCGEEAADPRVAGQWHGKIEVPGSPVVVGVEFTGRRSGVVAIPSQRLAGHPLGDVVAEPEQVRFGIPDVPGDARFAGRLDETAGTIIGDFRQSGQTFGLTLDRAPVPLPGRPQEPRPPYPYLSEEVSYRSGDITVAGTLTRPFTPAPVPAVVLATGSGPQNRDEELYGHRPFLLLADTLTRAGYAVLRTDDRGVGGTGGNLNQADYDDLSGDLEAGIGYLRGRPDIDPNTIGLLGHSEGGYLAPMVAARPENRVAFVILMAAPAITGTEVVLDQSIRAFTAAGASAQELDAHRAFLDDWITALRAGQLTKADRLSETYNRTLPAELRLVSTDLTGQNTPYMAALVSYDPEPALTALRMPVLAFYGSKDLQVTPDPNVATMRRLLSGDRDAEVRLFQGLNHLMQPAYLGEPGEYPMIETTIAPEVLDTVTGWLAARGSAG